jgi:hypothetical protein
MVEQAADAHAAIASLDFDGVIELLGNAERLRALATAALQAQAEQARQERRRGGPVPAKSKKGGGGRG